MEWVKAGRIRSNLSQAAGWLILLGNQEDGYSNTLVPDSDKVSGWKAGAYEPAFLAACDADYTYVVDLATKDIRAFEGNPDIVSTLEVDYSSLKEIVI